MSSTGELVVRLVGLAVIVATLLTTSWTWRFRHRWGSIPGPASVAGVGPYRRAAVRSHLDRGTPLRVSIVAGLGVAWGLLTTLVFAPGGFVFLLAPARHDPARQLLLTLSGLGVFGTAIGGLALGWFLVRVSRALVRREAEVLERALPIATWSGIHHTVVFGAFALFSLHEDDPSLALAAAAPCAIGWAHAWALTHAARWVAAQEDEKVWVPA